MDGTSRSIENIETVTGRNTRAPYDNVVHAWCTTNFRGVHRGAWSKPAPLIFLVREPPSLHCLCLNARKLTYCRPTSCPVPK